MEKISIKIIGRKFYLNSKEFELKQEIDLLSLSPRRYENFVFFAHHPIFLTEDVIKLLERKRGKWKNVTFWSAKFQNEERLEKFLESVSDSVENLQLRNLSFVNSSSEKISTKDAIQFKKLKILSLCNLTNIRWFLEKLKNCDKLEELEIEGMEEDDKRMNVKALSELILNANGIRKLQVLQWEYNDDFFIQLSKQKLQHLMEFKLKVNSQKSFINNGFSQFLRTHMITNLTIDAKFEKEIMQDIFGMPMLKKLRFSTPFIFDSIDLPKSSSIIEFQVDFECKSDLLVNFTNAMPNLRVLRN